MTVPEIIIKFMEAVAADMYSKYDMMPSHDETEKAIRAALEGLPHEELIDMTAYALQDLEGFGSMLEICANTIRLKNKNKKA